MLSKLRLHSTSSIISLWYSETDIYLQMFGMQLYKALLQLHKATLQLYNEYFLIYQSFHAILQSSIKIVQSEYLKFFK